MARYAAIDVGTNSVLLLVAERGEQGHFVAVEEQAEITRLGRGVDATRRLAPEAIEETLAVVERFVAAARAQGVTGIAITATSAARDAANGAEFLGPARARTGVPIEILSGDDEARLSFASAYQDFGGAGALAVVDIGGGSTEVILGDRSGVVSFRRSFDVGAVRLTERHVRGDPPSLAELEAVRAGVRDGLAGLPRAPSGAVLVGIAGTVTTLLGVSLGLEVWDSARVQGATLTRREVEATVGRLAALPVADRRRVAGLQPRRADVVVAGGLVLEGVLTALGLEQLVVSDRGLRWGLLAERFGGAS
jgi:exopolyphosphatase/guanosine-5'-triphosphate,3'-diphosphate pyrophosphatase